MLWEWIHATGTFCLWYTCMKYFITHTYIILSILIFGVLVKDLLQIICCISNRTHHKVTFSSPVITLWTKTPLRSMSFMYRYMTCKPVSNNYWYTLFSRQLSESKKFAFYKKITCTRLCPSTSCSYLRIRKEISTIVAWLISSSLMVFERTGCLKLLFALGLVHDVGYQ